MKNTSEKLWYAIQKDSTDDWGFGSFNRMQAIKEAKKINGFISVIDDNYDEFGNGNGNPVCIKEIKGYELDFATLTKEEEIEILMYDRCTRSDAESYLKRGTIIYRFDDLAEIDAYQIELRNMGYEEEEVKEITDMFKGHYSIDGWGCVNFPDTDIYYFIEYVI